MNVFTEKWTSTLYLSLHIYKFCKQVEYNFNVNRRVLMLMLTNGTPTRAERCSVFRTHTNTRDVFLTYKCTFPSSYHKRLINKTMKI